MGKLNDIREKLQAGSTTNPAHWARLCEIIALVTNVISMASGCQSLSELPNSVCILSPQIYPNEY